MIARARSGKKTGPGRLRSTAITSAKTRMNTSQTRKIFTFSMNARAMSGNELEMSPQSKKVRFTSGQPADWVTATITTVTKTAVLSSAIATPCAPSPSKWSPPSRRERRSTSGSERRSPSLATAAEAA